MWYVDSSDEYDSWFLTLDEACKEAVLERVLLLKQYGPNLPRPYADVLHGSKKYKNLKELRNQTQKHVLRIAYYFDFVQIILISYIVFSFRTLPNKIIAFCLLGIYMLFRLNQFLINTYNEEIVPYKFVNLF